MTYSDPNIDEFQPTAEDCVVEPVRSEVQDVLRTRERRLASGSLVRFTYDMDLGMPHFRFFSHEISSTGFRSDFFGTYGEELTESEIAEAFDVRANKLHRQHKAEMREQTKELAKEKSRRVRDEREIVQLPLAF